MLWMAAGDEAPAGERSTAPATPGAPRLACWIASLGPLGHFPIAPASFASLVLAALYVLLSPAARPPLWDLAVLAAVTAIGVWAADRAERRWGHDARQIVVDEAAGMAMTLLFLPGGLRTAALAFFFFRIFDVLKPFPAGRAERLPGGLGVMADDVMAGVYAHLAVRLCLYLWAPAV